MHGTHFLYVSLKAEGQAQLATEERKTMTDEAAALASIAILLPPHKILVRACS